jgi:predicted transcriptional regulator
MYSSSKKQEAIKLRKEGFSFSYISKMIGISKSTLSIWLKNISFVPNEFTNKSISEAHNKVILTSRVDKMQSLIIANNYAENVVGKMSERDIFLSGLGIYIGEGSKTGNMTRIVNSDPRIIAFSIVWLKKCFGLSDSNFRIRIHMYPDSNLDKTLDFWRKQTNLPEKAFQSPHIDNRINKKKSNENKLPYGTAHLTVVGNGTKELGVLLHRKIIATIDRVLKAGLV